MVRSALFLLSGNTVISLLSLARNLIIARMISVEDYGIAATFLMVLSAVEMTSQFGLQQQIVQSNDGNRPRFQAVLQGFQVFRGLIAAVILFLLAHPIARFLQVPEIAWAYQVMACVPILMSLIHFDIYRLNRNMEFGPLLFVGFVPAAISLLAVWPLVAWFGDYRVGLYALILQLALAAITSHVFAKRAYRLRFDLQVIRGAFRYGWPLLVNGLLLFLSFQGAKIIVGREIGVEALAIFAMGFTLTLTPVLVISRSATSFFLPQVSAAKDSPAELQRLSHVSIEACLMMAVIFLAGVALVGKPIVFLLLGEDYAPLLGILVWLAALQAINIGRTGSAIISLATGQTENNMIANAVRVISLPVCWYVLTVSGDLMVFLWLLLGAEALSYAVALWLVRWRAGIALGGLRLSHLGFVAVLGVICADAIRTTDPTAPAIGSGLLWGGLPILMVGLALTMGALRDYVLTRRRGAA